MYGLTLMFGLSLMYWLWSVITMKNNFAKGHFSDHVQFKKFNFSWVKERNYSEIRKFFGTCFRKEKKHACEQHQRRVTGIPLINTTMLEKKERIAGGPFLNWTKERTSAKGFWNRGCCFFYGKIGVESTRMWPFPPLASQNMSVFEHPSMKVKDDNFFSFSKAIMQMQWTRITLRSRLCMCVMPFSTNASGSLL